MSFCGTLLAWFTCVLCFFFSFHPFFVVVLVYEVSRIHVMRLESTFFFVQYNGWCMTFLYDDVASVCVFFSCQSAFCVLFFFSYVCFLHAFPLLWSTLLPILHRTIAIKEKRDERKKKRLAYKNVS